jgi:hypothetical protein
MKTLCYNYVIQNSKNNKAGDEVIVNTIVSRL